ncbi:uncharacterized protein [Hemitrygon akajei]|uniref:uncharacterized protein n=1 Tax=Hemitrygon akajei TaxID=2704970 RepID=UPI003BFA38F5
MVEKSRSGIELRSGKTFPEMEQTEQTKKTEEPVTLAGIFSSIQDMKSEFGSLNIKIDKLTSSNGKLEKAISTIQDSLKNLDSQLQTLQQTTTGIESEHDLFKQTIKDQGMKISSMEKKINEITSELSKTKKRMVDLDSRGRRRNLRILGLPENTEAGDLLKLFSEMLYSLFNETLETSPLIDRAHRIPFSRRSAELRPRAVVLSLHYYTTKEAILREARKKRKLFFNSTHIPIVEDYPPEIFAERKKYREVMSEMYKLDLNPSLCFPAKLIIFPEKSQPLRIYSPQEGWEYIKNFKVKPTE